MTSLGAIDLLGEVSGIGGYEAVRKLSKSLRIGGNTFDVLSIEGLIRTKRAAARRKDLLVLPELEALSEIHKHTELPKEK